jgi:hypothetical protein
MCNKMILIKLWSEKQKLIFDLFLQLLIINNVIKAMKHDFFWHLKTLKTKIKQELNGFIWKWNYRRSDGRYLYIIWIRFLDM